MIRADLEKIMKERDIKTISLIFNENDKLGKYCYLQSGILMDYTGHRVDRKKDIWGYMEWNNGESSRIKFQ